VQTQKVQDHQFFALVLGRVVERLRRRRQWTQGELAFRVGITQSMLSRIEAGKAQPDVFLFTRLAAAFDMPVHDLQQHIEKAAAATKQAATAASGKKSWDDVAAVVGLVALGGLIAFAVAVLLEDPPNSKRPSSR